MNDDDVDVIARGVALALDLAARHKGWGVGRAGREILVGQQRFSNLLQTGELLGHLLALEMAQIAVQEAIRLGATFSDARFLGLHREEIRIRNSDVECASIGYDRGLGVRVLVNGAWGFSGISNPTRHDAVIAARKAVEHARAASVLIDSPVELIHEPPHSGVFRTPIERDPFGVPIESKIALLLEAERHARVSPKIRDIVTRFVAERRRILFVNSEGAEIDQEIVHSGAMISVGASSQEDYQVRSYPDAYLEPAVAQGWEYIEALDLAKRAPEVAEEALMLLAAAPCPERETTLILAADPLALQIHETCGHAILADIVAGQERHQVGGSFLRTDDAGRFLFGNKNVNIYADARLPGGVGTFGYDDEGVEAQRVNLVVDGYFLGFLTNRELARRMGQPRASGSTRAAGYTSSPLVQMSNVCLEPGTGGNLEALIADTKDGILMQTGRSRSLDEVGQHFLLGCELAWEIKNGKKTRVLKNPAYAGTTSTFWSACESICEASDWRIVRVPSNGRGRPLQVVSTGHGTAPARFLKIRVGMQVPPSALPERAHVPRDRSRAASATGVAPKRRPRGKRR